MIPCSVAAAELLEDRALGREEDVVDAALAVLTACRAAHDADLAMRIAFDGLDDPQKRDRVGLLGQLVAAGPARMRVRRARRESGRP